MLYLGVYPYMSESRDHSGINHKLCKAILEIFRPPPLWAHRGSNFPPNFTQIKI